MSVKRLPLDQVVSWYNLLPVNVLNHKDRSSLLFGEVQEWLNWLVSKTSVRQRTEGSNPSLSAIEIARPSGWAISMSWNAIRTPEGSEFCQIY